MKRFRLLLFVLVLALAGLANVPPANAGLTCVGVCVDREAQCFVDCHNNGSCDQFCRIGYDDCIAACG
jgi:hypothetical protein